MDKKDFKEKVVVDFGKHLPMTLTVGNVSYQGVTGNITIEVEQSGNVTLKGKFKKLLVCHSEDKIKLLVSEVWDVQPEHVFDELYKEFVALN